PRAHVIGRNAELVRVGIGDRTPDLLLVFTDPFAELGHGIEVLVLGLVADLELRLRAQDLDDRSAERGDDRDPRGPFSDRRLDAIDDRAVALEEHVLLAVEVTEERGHGDLGLLRDRLHGRALVAAVPEQPEGGADQPLLGLLLLPLTEPEARVLCLQPVHPATSYMNDVRMQVTQTWKPLTDGSEYHILPDVRSMADQERSEER